MEMDVVKQDLPPLLPIGMQAALGATISLPKNEMSFGQLDVRTPMFQLPSGHRTIRVDKLGGPSAFSCPEPARLKHGVSNASFRAEGDAEYKLPLPSSPSSPSLVSESAEGR
eukprot:5762555-Pyramimonas_sp.AAC.1